jgi:uncharacterized protein YndB with AHSA1/START domain
MIMMNRAKITVEPNQLSFKVERTFNAPRDKVFLAMTEKDKLERWWVGPGYTTRVEHLDAREGGLWRFIQTGDGWEHGFHGYFHMVSPEMIIQTFEYDGLDERGHVTLQKIELMDIGDGKTKLISTSVFLSAEDRDGMIHSGMEEGLQYSYSKLDEILMQDTCQEE